MHLVFLFLALVAPSDAPKGRRIELKDLDATLFVPEDFKARRGDVVDVLLHLHGAASVIEPAIVESGLNSVLIEFNRKGLSKVYAEPFSDPDLFPRLLDAALAALKAEKLVAEPKLGRVVVSSFSAGFGGVRELLQVPSTFNRIDGLIMADSIYCSYTGVLSKREVNPFLMVGFRRFAAEAAAGRKTFVLTHSAQVPEGYASTTETADYLIKALDLKDFAVTMDWGPTLSQARAKAKGQFVVLGFAGKEANDHMAHLRRIGSFWKFSREIATPKPDMP